jgi:hypothetical protein
LSSKNSGIAQLDNIDYYTWLYIVNDLPVPIQNSLVVSCVGEIFVDEFIQRSWREPQLSFWIGDEEHLEYAQALFGLNFGIGVHFTVSCQLKKNRAIDTSDTLNVVPFENSSHELVCRGVAFRYKPGSRLLSMTVRY